MIDPRCDILESIIKTINENQETFIAYYLKQNPDTDLSKVKLCYGNRGAIMSSGLRIKAATIMISHTKTNKNT